MPSVPLSFRAVCGSFASVFVFFMTKRAREKAATRITMLRPKTRLAGVILGLTLTYLFWGSLLLCCGDVEQNPGPGPKTDSLRQTRLGSAGRGTGADRTGGTLDRGQTTPPSPQDPSLADLMSMLQTVNCRFDGMDSRFDGMNDSMKELKEQYDTLYTDLKNLREEVDTLKKENVDLAKQNSDLLDRVDQLERKTDDLEGRSKRNNLIFYGIPRGQNETNEQAEGKLRDVLTDKLDMVDDVEFERVHRLNAKPDSPIIACCFFYKDKVKVLKAKKKLKGSSIFVGEDFSLRVREIRRRLSPHLKGAREEGKRAVMVFDHLIIDGKKFFLDDRHGLKESK